MAVGAGGASMGSEESLSVLIPAFNEGAHIREVLSRLLQVLDEMELPYEILVVSDGSTDDTVTQARRITARELVVLSYKQRRGKGYALRYAWERCSGTYIAFLDADLDLHPEGLRTLSELVRFGGADGAVGSKTHPDSKVVYPRFRRFQSLVFRAIVRTRFRLDVSDTQTGMKLFRREVIETVNPLLESDGFAFDLELLVFANDHGFRIVEGPVNLDFGFSSTTGARAVFQVLGEMRRVAIRRRKLHRLGHFEQGLSDAPTSVRSPEQFDS
jgi:glycosyltransferase involved in cell wall biosynthesis